MDMTIAANLGPYATGPHSGPSASGGSNPPTGRSPLSPNRIREIRETFERENQHLQQSWGNGAHQTLLMAMYEGTEHLVNKNVNDFQLMEYLESIKLTAQTLQKQGVSLREFKSELLRQSQDSVAQMLRQI